LPSEDNDADLEMEENSNVLVQVPLPLDANKIVFHEPLPSKYSNQLFKIDSDDSIQTKTTKNYNHEKL
jgi:hypothetical protein